MESLDVKAYMELYPELIEQMSKTFSEQEYEYSTNLDKLWHVFKTWHNNVKQQDNFMFTTSKKGALEYLEILYEKAGNTKEEIKKLLERDNEQLKEGLYEISIDGVKPYENE